MSIWGRRDSEPPAEEAHEGRAEAQNMPEPAAEHQAAEPARWRAQGQPSASLERDPADAPPPTYEQAPSEARAPSASEDPAGADAPVPVLTGVAIDGENAIRDPGLAETSADQAGAHDAETGGPAATQIPEPTVAAAHEPGVTEARASAEPRDGAQEPAMTGAAEQAAAPASAATGAGQPAAAAITQQRWSEILAGFVDDPRASVTMAADAVDEAIDKFVNSVRARQCDLAAIWQSAGADTEQLRTTLREYRKLGQRVQQLDLGDKTGG